VVQRKFAFDAFHNIIIPTYYEHSNQNIRHEMRRKCRGNKKRRKNEPLPIAGRSRQKGSEEPCGGIDLVVNFLGERGGDWMENSKQVFQIVLFAEGEWGHSHSLNIIHTLNLKE
jgi:hypothetical protein